LLENERYEPNSAEVSRLADALGEPVRLWIEVEPRKEVKT
jgi:hypothetical protein